jgi:hypothetical protein
MGFRQRLVFSEYFILDCLMVSDYIYAFEGSLIGKTQVSKICDAGSSPVLPVLVDGVQFPVCVGERSANGFVFLCWKGFSNQSSPTMGLIFKSYQKPICFSDQI